MPRLPRIIPKTLSIRLSLTVVFAMAILLVCSLTVMLYFSRKAVKEEALQKAMQTLEGTVQRIDNILLSVEQATGNQYFNMLNHLNDPDKVTAYCRELVESNKYIDGAAVAFKPYYYHDREFFMAYFHREEDRLEFTDSPIIQADIFGNHPYTEQVWFTRPMTTSTVEWLKPSTYLEDGGEALLTFSLPIPGNDGNPIGVIGVDVSLNILSRIIQTTKPSPNSYCTLIAGDGSYIIHPDTTKLQTNIFKVSEKKATPSMKAAARAMLSRKTGYKSFQMNGTNYYVFYKPFTTTTVSGRAIDRPNWSIGIIYPENDIFGDYKLLLYYVLGIAIVGLILLYIFCRIIIRHQLMPLVMLTKTAQHIADGNYDVVIPDSRHRDEVGSLQTHFKLMQKTLVTNIEELNNLNTTLQKREEDLKKAYEKAQEADKMKTAFLHNMSDKMALPANTIFSDVATLCGTEYSNLEKEKTDRLTDDIQEQGNAIADLLDALLKMSEKQLEKGGLS